VACGADAAAALASQAAAAELSSVDSKAETTERAIAGAASVSQLKLAKADRELRPGEGERLDAW
jgi:hypothetical protein